MVVDCRAMEPEKGKAKELDYKIAELLENKFNFTDCKNTLFKKMRSLRQETSHLTPKQILQKDTKSIERILVPSLPMLVQDFLKLQGGYNGLKEFATESNATIVVLKGADRGKKDVAVFYNKGQEILKDKILVRLFDSQKYKGYDFEFSELQSDFECVTLLRQGNLQWSRKQLMPLIKDAVLENSCLNDGAK